MKRLLFLIVLSTFSFSSCSVFKSNTKTKSHKKLLKKPNGPYSNYVRAIISAARGYTGTPYLSGGNDRSGIDCSGLLCTVYAEVGLEIPRVSWQQAEFGTEIEKESNIKVGDWIFYVPNAGQAGYVSHVGIVTEVRSSKDIRFIHASSSRGVREDNLFSNYFKNRYVKAIRPF
jgi:probable lipoprotein NlpC